MPMTLRWLRRVVVPTTGPRSAALGAPQWMGRAPSPLACEVRRIWRGEVDEAAEADAAEEMDKVAEGARDEAGADAVSTDFAATSEGIACPSKIPM